jgi:predicted nucleotidyltransferase
MIDLDEQTLAEVLMILDRQLAGCEVRLFGSRVRGTARRYSDIDLALVGAGPLPDRDLAAARDAFADSDLPCRVDLVDWHAISPEFRRVIEEQGYEILRWNPQHP